MFSGWRDSCFSGLQFWLNPLKNNCLNVWYVGNSLYLCNTESDTKNASGGRSSQISTEAKSYKKYSKL